MIPNCLSCASAFPVVEGGKIDFSRKLCKAGPPTPVALPAPNGQIQIIPCFPVVNAECWCKQHDPKLPGEITDEPKETTQ